MAHSSSSLRHIDLCAGSGAFSLAAGSLGFSTTYANDFCPKAKLCFDANVRDCRLDCRPLQDALPDGALPASCDLITGGPPCQPFSSASENRLGLDDPRAQVLDSILEVARRCQPRWLLCENVLGLLSHDGGRTFTRVLAKAKAFLPGYQCKWAKYDTATHTGVPQNRKRVYIAWFRDAADHDAFEFPQPRPALRPVSDFLQPEAEVPDWCYHANRSSRFAQQLQGMTLLPVRETQAVYSRRRDGTIKQSASSVCGCLMAGMAPHSNDLPIVRDDRGSRMLTPREMFALQGFPASYILPEELSPDMLYKVAGNAVSLPVAQLVIQALLDQQSS